MRHKFYIPLLLLCTCSFSLSAQRSDSTRQLQEIIVQAYPGNHTLLRLPSSAAVLSSNQIRLQSVATLLPAVNTIPGVRMEERSPGSYRLSIRGSLLRSPFGIRNVKVYMDEMPLTDAGGNTYLNLLDAGSVQGIEVLKGPDGSLFGANSGGVVLLHPMGGDSSRLQFGMQGGSYGAFQEQVRWQQRSGPYQVQVSQAYQQADGYRQNTRMRRAYLQTVQQWQYAAHQRLKLMALYSDLGYRTPGGLTAAQAEANPKAARPATPTLPGAIQQQAGIYNRTFQAGLVHEADITSTFKHVISVSGTNTHFENPFITNYEARDENTAAVRTYFALHDRYLGHGSLRYSWYAGLEWQRTSSDIINYGNRRGQRDTVQAADKLVAQQHFYFTRFTLQQDRWVWEAAASLNYFSYTFRNAQTPRTRRNFTPQLMPRVALSYLFTPGLSARATVSRGYSPPAIAEVRASDNIINTALQAENGWNYELGIRSSDQRQRYWVDASVFHYRLRDAIVRNLRADGTEFFRNAGSVKQTGVELQGMLWLVTPHSEGAVRGLQLHSSYTLSDFKFDDYISAGKNFSGKQLTGVPRHTVVSNLLLQLPLRFYVFAQHNFTDRLPLVDDNAVYAKAYHLVQCKIGWETPASKPIRLAFYAGVDNLLNQRYSLGNDLNAIGGRYFNPAPDRNYYAGVSLRL